MRVRERPGHPSLFEWLDSKEARVVELNAALEHERQAGRGVKQPEPWTLDRGRVSEIQKLIRLRHNGPCDTNDGALYLQAALPHLVRLHAGPALLGKVLGWAKAWLPGLPLDQVACEIDEEAAANGKPMKADSIASLLGVTREEREAGRLRTIGAVNFTRRQRLADRKRKDAAYQAEKRLKAGATPRSQPNVAKAKAFGISLSTYKRRLIQGLGTETPEMRELISSAVVRSTCNPLRDRVTVCEQTALGPAKKASPTRSVGADGHSPRSIPKIVRTAEPLPPPLPEGRGFKHPDLFEETLTLGTAAQSVIDAYTGGRMPPEVVRAVEAAQRARLLPWENVAHQIGVSPPQLSNVLKGRFGLSPRAAANLKEWLAAA